MSRTTTLQLIAAVITIAVLVVLHQGAGWFLDKMSGDYSLGFISGAIFVWLIWLYEDRREQRSRRAGNGTAEQQSARHTIDL